MQKVITIKADGTMEIVEENLTLEFMQGAVGGWVQAVELIREADEIQDTTVSLWLNEEGKFSGLERNNVATYLWARSYGLTDVIMGDVVLTGGTDEDGDTLGLTEGQVSDLMNMLAVFA